MNIIIPKLPTAEEIEAGGVERAEVDKLEAFLRHTPITRGITVNLASAIVGEHGEVFDYEASVVSRFTNKAGDLIICTVDGKINVSSWLQALRALISQ